MNVFALASVLGVFVLADVFAHESGLLAVVVMGMVLGNSNSQYLKELLYFKESLSVLLISILFILLAANINIEDLMLIYNWNTVALFAVVVFVLRPIGVFLSTYNSSLQFNEKLFIISNDSSYFHQYLLVNPWRFSFPNLYLPGRSDTVGG